jgi:hypothetical protein
MNARSMRSSTNNFGLLSATGSTRRPFRDFLARRLHQCTHRHIVWISVFVIRFEAPARIAKLVDQRLTPQPVKVHQHKVASGVRVFFSGLK